MVEIKKSNNTLVFILCGLAAAIIIIIISIYNKNNLTNSSYILTLIIVVVICASVAFGFWYKNKHQEDVVKNALIDSKRVPQPITIAECRQLIRDNVMFDPNYSTYFNDVTEENEVLGHGVKNVIYTYKGTSCHKPFQRFVIIINRNYPNLHTILIYSSVEDENTYEINKRKNSLCMNPEEEPDKIVTRRRNAMLGTEEEVEETQHKREEKKEEKKEEGELKSKGDEK